MRQIAALLLRLVMLPLMLVLVLMRWVGRGVETALSPLLRSADCSPGLSALINSLSTLMATQRGLLLMVGSGIVLLSLVTHVIVIVALVGTKSFDGNLYWLCIPFALLHIGVLTGFVGIMLAVPLGQGYKSQQQ